MMPNELIISRPEIKRRISALEVLTGPYVSPEKYISLMSEADYEIVVNEWATDYIGRKYKKVRAFAGAGDKGRDIVGYYDDGTIDIYQCKHYKNKVAPTTIYVELGKLCHYTFSNDYAIPKNYFIVAPHGCGPDLLDMIDNPKTFNQKLIDNWDKYCREEITKKQKLDLTGNFKKYVEEFDFSIVTDLDPAEFVKQHAQTMHHILRFGTAIKKYRDVIPLPEKDIHAREQKYTKSLFEVYEEDCGQKVNSISDLQGKDPYMKHFIDQRRSFYSAESLEKFSRENFPDAHPMPFDDLKDDAEVVLNTTLQLSAKENGYRRVLLSNQEIKRQDFSSNPLSLEIKPLDKDGLCHHLVNEERITWIIK